MSAAIPRFPTVIVTMAADGSAHLNSAGTHADYPAGDAAHTRVAITQFVAAIAQGLHRPVRMTVHDQGTTWLLAVAPDATVTQLEAAPLKKGRGSQPVELVPVQPEPAKLPPLEQRPPAPIQPVRAANPWSPPAAPPASYERAAAPLASEPTMLVRREVPAAAAITVDVDGRTKFAVDSTALVGRNPVPLPGEVVGRLVKLEDPGKTTSKTHLLLERRGDRLWMTDRGSANGSRLLRAAGDKQQLSPEKSYELVDGDCVDLGGQILTVRIVRP